MEKQQFHHSIAKVLTNIILYGDCCNNKRPPNVLDQMGSPQRCIFQNNELQHSEWFRVLFMGRRWFLPRFAPRFFGSTVLAVGIRNKRTQNRKNFGPCCTERRSGNIPRPSVEQAGVGLGVNLGRFGGVRSIYIGNGKNLGDFGIWALESSDLLLIYTYRQDMPESLHGPDRQTLRKCPVGATIPPPCCRAVINKGV